MKMEINKRKNKMEEQYRKVFDVNKNERLRKVYKDGNGLLRLW